MAEAFASLCESALREIIRAHGVVADARRRAAQRSSGADKGYTAAGFGLATDQWHDFIKNDPPLAAGATAGHQPTDLFGGGYTLEMGDQIIGGIGVSGGHYAQDMEVAAARLTALWQ